MKRHALTLLVAGLALTACTGEAADDDAKQKDPSAAARAVAREYQQAANVQEWRTACRLSTAALRRAMTEQCAPRSSEPTTTAPTPSAPASPSPTASDSPPTYADGSTMKPLPSKTRAPGPDRASTGPIKTGKPVKVPAVDDHPAGYGVLVTYTVSWPTDTSTSRKALRVVQQGGGWRIDQHEDVHDGDLGHGDPVPAILAGRPS
ncbi:hypothetical protein ACF1HU_35945 [Streptomyces olivaceus]|uniref:hypothetical protein n=1 Tax=Streptomyces olivaceus TaxID=47716 RepID=UPI0036FE37FA